VSETSSGTAVTTANPTEQLSAAWTEQARLRSQHAESLSQQASDVAAAIANGAPASLEQFVYASLGAHPSWKAMHEQIATVNEKLQPNVPLALFSKGAMRYFGYPEKSGSRSHRGDTSHDENAFTYRLENYEQRHQRLSRAAPMLGDVGIAGAAQYFSALSLPMRAMYDFTPGLWALREKRQENVVLENMFRSSVITVPRVHSTSAEYRFHMTTLDDEEPGEKLVLASGLSEIVAATHKNSHNMNLRRLEFAIKHMDDDPEAYID